jgi:hypothetical protein
MNAAFGVDLHLYRQGESTYRGREGDIHLPQVYCAEQGLVTPAVTPIPPPATRSE